MNDLSVQRVAEYYRVFVPGEAVGFIFVSVAIG